MPVLTGSASSNRSSALQVLAAEIAKLSSSILDDSAFIAAVLRQLISSSNGLGGAVWLIAAKGDGSASGISLRLAASIDLENGAGEEGGEQRKQVLRAAAEVVTSKQPLVLMPLVEGGTPASPDVLVNWGPHAIVGVPVRAAGDESLGTIQLWFARKNDPQRLADLALMIQALGAELGGRLATRNMRELSIRSQRQQRLLQFASDLTGLLDAQEAGALATAHAREMLGVNRVSMLVRRAGKWRVMGISGQNVIEHHGNLMTRMVEFVDVHQDEVPMVVTKPKESSFPAELADPRQISRQKSIANYFEDSQMNAVAVVHLRLGHGGSPVGVMVCESIERERLGPPGSIVAPCAPVIEMAQWLADLSGKAIQSAMIHQSVPFSRLLLKTTELSKLTSETRGRRWLTKAAIGIVVVGIAAFWPVKVKVEGACSVLPKHRALISTESPGRVEEILVAEGDRVHPGQIIARLDTRRLKSEQESSRQTRMRLEAESERLRGQGKEALARISGLEAQVAKEAEQRVQREIELSELRSPIEGIVMSKELHLKTGMFLQAGDALTEVASVDRWDLRIQVPEADISLIESSLKRGESLTVRYLLYTLAEHPLEALLTSPQQISPALQPGVSGGLFGITLPDLGFPQELQPIIRPGLTGRAKIELGKRPLGQVMLRHFYHWLRMRWWM